LASSQTRYISLRPEATIADAFSERASLSPHAIAYRELDSTAQQWRDYSWDAMLGIIGRVRSGLQREGMLPGERIAIMLRNGIHWVVFDQAAYAHGLVPIPLFVDDRPDNVAFIVNDADVRLIVIDGEEHWKRLKTVSDRLEPLKRIVTVKPVTDASEPRLRSLSDWIPKDSGALERPPTTGADLATIVYTSGTTGRPKGVMLSHRNMLANAQSALEIFEVYPHDVFLSFLPLSHMFERTCGYYLNVVSGAKVVFARSVPQLADDLKSVQPTVLISVPRIYERFLAAINDQLRSSAPLKRKLFDLAVEIGWSRFEYQQGRKQWKPELLLWPLLKPLVADKILARLGGCLRVAISGGAPLSPAVSKVFVGLGLPICQGYGMTEASPLLCANRVERNDPRSVGPAAPGVELKIGENNVLLARGANIMMGYWNNPQATQAVLSAQGGWLNTGDQARIENDFVYITGRTKEIIVLGNGEKVPPADMELAIQLDPLFEQVLVFGEARPYLVALVLLNENEWIRIAQENALDPNMNEAGKSAAQKFLVNRIAGLIKQFPGYAQVRKVAVVADKWSIDNGFMTPTLKLKRGQILDKYRPVIDELYKGHGT
jgi:long-chain acyl-CoA synthetase